MDLAKLNFLVVGQHKTSRTETIEAYLKDKVSSLGVIGIVSPFASYNVSRCTFYDEGEKRLEFPLLNFSIKKVRWWNQPLMCISFFVYVILVLFSVYKLNKKFDVFIGIATFSSMLGVIFKKLGKVNTVIYYCLDYYPTPKKISFNKFVNMVYKVIDKWLVKKADIVWEISPRIKEARQKYSGLDMLSYETKIVPLGYANNINRDCPLKDRERWTLGFVGTLSENQGLQMVIEAMPKLIEKFPDIKVRILGHGPYASELKSLTKKFEVEDKFIFHGFVSNDEEVYNILSRCMVGLATWTGDEEDNSLYADPGKPKLYALLGLPIVITKAPYVSKIISEVGAGEVIDYQVDDFVRAIEKVIGKDDSFLRYKEGIERFKPNCLAERIFDKAFKEEVN